MDEQRMDTQAIKKVVSIAAAIVAACKRGDLELRDALEWRGLYTPLREAVERLREVKDEK